MQFNYRGVSRFDDSNPKVKEEAMKSGSVTSWKVLTGLAAGAAIGITLVKLGWFPRFAGGGAKHFTFFDYDLEWNRLTAPFLLWIAFSLYWSIAARNSAKSQDSESKWSTALHQIVLNVALVLLFWPAPGLGGWFLPQRWHFLSAVGAAIQIAFFALAIWARRHLGKNWSAEVRIGEGHELVRSGPYRIVRHPIYSAMLGMFLGTALASSQVHALVAIALLFLAYIRKTRLEEEILKKTFGAQFDAYRRNSWSLVPLVY
jgi:protein-S-isoprenylcysteine O-methyltransferase Ste14